MTLFVKTFPGHHACPSQNICNASCTTNPTPFPPTHTSAPAKQEKSRCTVQTMKRYAAQKVRYHVKQILSYSYVVVLHYKTHPVHVVKCARQSPITDIFVMVLMHTGSSVQ